MIDTNAVIEKATKMTALATNINTTTKYSEDILSGKGVLKIGYGNEVLNMNSVFGPDMLADIKAYIKTRAQQQIEDLNKALEEVVASNTPSSHKRDKKG